MPLRDGLRVDSAAVAGAEGRGKGFEWSFNCSFGGFECRPKEGRERKKVLIMLVKNYGRRGGSRTRPEIEESGPGSLHLKLPPAIYFKDQIN